MDFGSFPQLEKQENSFVLVNIGNSLLVIQDIVTSCGCTKVEYSKEPVRPGGTLEVKVLYEAEDAGYFNGYGVLQYGKFSTSFNCEREC